MAERRFIFVILISENSSVLAAAVGLQLKRASVSVKLCPRKNTIELM